MSRQTAAAIALCGGFREKVSVPLLICAGAGVFSAAEDRSPCRCARALRSYMLLTADGLRELRCRSCCAADLRLGQSFPAPGLLRCRSSRSLPPSLSGLGHPGLAVFIGHPALASATLAALGALAHPSRRWRRRMHRRLRRAALTPVDNKWLRSCLALPAICFRLASCHRRVSIDGHPTRRAYGVLGARGGALTMRVVGIQPKVRRASCPPGYRPPVARRSLQHQSCCDWALSTNSFGRVDSRMS